MEREFKEQKGIVKERQNIVKMAERQVEKCHYRTSVELARIMSANKPNAGRSRKKRQMPAYLGGFSDMTVVRDHFTKSDKQIEKESRALEGSSLYDGEGRGCRMGIEDDLKKVGAVTDLAESKI